MKSTFILSRATKIQSEMESRALVLAVKRMLRDMEIVLSTTIDAKKNRIQLMVDNSLLEEAFIIDFQKEEVLRIKASDELGFIYGLHYISERFLGVTSFWFWNDQQFKEVEAIAIPIKRYESPKAIIRFRGWFVNDEVLLNNWNVEGDLERPWEMIFEALLRCGGNMVIPGTDKNAKIYRQLASDMGLWITHHHAEPLGAEMFSRVYPELNPSYAENPELFHQLWDQAIDEQKDYKVIWNLGFRGQGDCPFWLSDPQYDTPKSRGDLISSLINQQYDLLKRYYSKPICCTNLYGEIMELYKEGHINFNREIIKIWADNGYGKMVSRRQGNWNPRVCALPESNTDTGKHHGIYYHVSFYDLQAANHITMLPNSVDFLNSELENAFIQGAGDYLIVNCSNIRPHVYYLDAIRKIWYGARVNAVEHGKQYAQMYYSEQHAEAIAGCFIQYPKCTLAFGSHEDEHAGEQFYTYSTRILATQWMRDYYSRAPQYQWAVGDVDLLGQIKWLNDTCNKGSGDFLQLVDTCNKVSEELKGEEKLLFDATILLQANIHNFCLQGTQLFCDAFAMFEESKYLNAFYLIGSAADCFQKANDIMRAAEYGKWKDFYANDCLTDMKFTSYILRSLMGYVRSIGDGPDYFRWQREILYSPNDNRVILITNYENHLTDAELYMAMVQQAVPI